MVRDHAVLRHHTGWRLLLPADIHAGSHIPLQLRTLIDQLRNSLGLVRRQRIHRVDDQCLDSPLPAVLIAVFQNRIQEALRFSGAGTRRDEGGPSIIPRQPLESLLLVNVRKILGMDCLKHVRHLRSHAERKPHSNIGRMVNRVSRGNEIPHRTPERRVRHRERRLDVISDALFQLLCEDGRYHAVGLPSQKLV